MTTPVSAARLRRQSSALGKYCGLRLLASASGRIATERHRPKAVPSAARRLGLLLARRPDLLRSLTGQRGGWVDRSQPKSRPRYSLYRGLDANRRGLFICPLSTQTGRWLRANRRFRVIRRTDIRDGTPPAIAPSRGDQEPATARARRYRLQAGSIRCHPSHSRRRVSISAPAPSASSSGKAWYCDTQHPQTL